jgi:predicted HTH domain antitoxin
MTLLQEPLSVYAILAKAHQLPTADRQWLAHFLNRESDAPLPERASFEEAVALYLLDACSLGRAAELANVTRWDIQDYLKSQGISIPAYGDQSAEEMDAIAQKLEDEGVW